MKNHRDIYTSVLTFVVAVASVSLSLAQTKGVDKYGEMLFEGRPFFTDSALYNSYDLGGSPLGLFEKGSPRFDAQFDYRYDGLGDGSGQYWSAPLLTMGNPENSFFRVFYDPRILSDKNGGDDASLPLHRFGLVVAAQGASGALRAAFSAVGFYGDQEWDGGDENRMIAGFERIRFDLGSKVHPLLRLGLFVGGDMLYEKNTKTDTRRSFHTNLPEFGVNLDMGGEDFPVRGNLDFSYAWSRYVYTIVDGLNANAIRNDSLSLFLTTQTRVSLIDDDKLVLRPGLLLGFTNNSGERHEPEEGNNYPINLGDVIQNFDYGLTGFWFGVGTGAGVLNYVDAHVEYTLAALRLKCGSGYTAPAVESRTLHNFSLGVSSNLNKYVEMPIVITPRAAWFISGMSGVGVSQAHLSLDPLNAAWSDSQRSPYYYPPQYAPQNLLSGFSHLSGFTVGVDGQVLEGQASASVWATFLSDSGSDKGGLEFGARIGFLLR
ncbi:hypothetical protein R80B4_00090 [Fibrobacteres bacterium R8-0-B4]